MSEVIRIKIDLKKIDQSKCFKASSGAVYLDAALIPTAPTSYGDNRDEQTHMIVQDIPKEERLAGGKGAILGNGQEMGPRSEAMGVNTGHGGGDGEGEDDRIPF